MVGYERLRNPEGISDVADTHLPAAQVRDNLQATWIAQNLERAE
jgi:hypothetical protein